jgi:regulatory protein
MKKAQPTISGISTLGRGSLAVGAEGPASLNAMSRKGFDRGHDKGEWAGVAALIDRRGKMTETEGRPIDPAVLEKWALGYLERFASSAENLRRVLRRRVRRRIRGDDETVRIADGLIDALVIRYRESGLIDDAAYAAGRARTRLARGQSLRRIVAGLMAKGVGADDRAAALQALRETAADPDLAAACAFARRRRLGPFRRAPADRARELAAFARAGFARREAEAVLACPDPEAVAALLATDPE